LDAIPVAPAADYARECENGGAAEGLANHFLRLCTEKLDPLFHTKALCLGLQQLFPRTGSMIST